MNKNDRKEVEVSVFVHKSLSCNIRNDLGINNYRIKFLVTKIENTRSKSIILSVICKRPNGDLNASENYCYEKKNKNNNTKRILVGGCNVIILDFENNKSI